MKSKIFGVSLGSAIFIFLLIATLALVRPVYLRVHEALSDFEKTLSEKLEKETGLAISYQSLSPSIFIGVNLRNVSVYDVASKDALVGIKKATLTYNVFGFFSKNPTLGLKKLTLNGLTVEYDAMKERDFVNKIKNLLQKKKTENPSGENLQGEKSSGQGEKFTLEDKALELPLDIVIKNLSLHYSDSKNDLLATLKILRLNDFSLSDGLGLETSGKVFYKTALYKSRGKWTSFASNFSISGTLFPDFNGSSALVTFSTASGADYSLSHLDMLVNYANEKFEIRTMRTVLPFSFYANYDLKKEKLNLSGDFDRFNPLDLVSFKRKPEIIRKIDGSTISGSLSAGISKDSFDYKSDINIGLTKKLLGQSMNVGLKCNGNKEFLNIDKLSASGSFIDADFNGSLDIKRLQPSGMLTLNYFMLKNGGIISTELYLDSYRNGFTFVAPQIFLNEKSFTGLQFIALPGNKSIDFEFELLDFAHADYEESGRLQIAGSFLTGKEKFVQASLQISNIFADSLVDTAGFFLPAEKKEIFDSISKALQPFIFNTEAYFSTDFKDFSVNAPVCLFANTEKDRQIITFAMDGSKEALQLSSFDLLFGNQTAHAEIGIDFADTLSEFSFTTDLTVNSVPYRFFGNFSPQWIAVSGDYNFDAIVSIDENIGATIQFNQLPFSLGKFVFASSTNSVLRWGKETGFEADIVSLEIEEPSAYLQFDPHLALSGSLNKYGFEVENISYTDSVSSLDGRGSLVWNINDGIFDSIHASFMAESPLSTEKFSLLADLTNPSLLPFSVESLKNDFYFSSEISINAFPSSRLLALQNPENTISADITASGTVSNPFVSVSLHKSFLLLYGYPLAASGAFVLDDSGINIQNLNCDWSLLKLSDLNASFNPDKFNGSAYFTMDADLMGKTIHAPFQIQLDGAAPKKKFAIPDYYSVTLFSEKISGDFIASDFPLKIMAMHTPGRFDIATDVEDGFRAVYTTDGKFAAKAGKGSPIQFNLDGSIINNNMNLNLTGIMADMRFICSEIEIPFVTFNSGLLTGAVRVTGPTTDPEFTGAFSVSHPNFLIPFISTNYLHADKVIMTIGQGEAVVPPTLVSLGKGLASVQYRMDFNRWIPNSLELIINIDENRKVPLDLTFPLIHAKGLASGNLNLSFTLPRDISISGNVVADNTDVEIVASSLQNNFSFENLLTTVPKQEQANINVTVDFDILVGQKVQLLFNPFLRGVVAPGTPLSLYFDSYTGDMEFKSDITLRGGEVAWLNRNFYMKEGRIIFNENQDSIDPRVTIRAETRERDENGNLVTIIMSASNQPVSAFNPVFSANPAKSEREIMQLLGQVISADSTGVSDILGSGGDFFIQSTVIRRIENTLRELLNFDIFSIRTNVLQNSIKLSMDEDKKNKQMSVGNFIDNSTVYMGKYFGSSIYVDSMLHWSYDENKINNGTSVNGIVFQPELGFEMNSPYVNIRLGVAPDIDSLQKGLLDTWVPSTSMTLSWKFAF
ncbi:MAG: translocation/assembly module TamB [Treponema sp.]|nr:translocation/assembly module TamB [Treponema sp.]